MIMKEEYKQLLLKDLCARLPYCVIVNNPTTGDDDILTYSLLDDLEVVNYDYPKPYLRPMSSMTEEEKKVYKEFSSHLCGEIVAYHLLDYLNAHHLDYRGLIPMGLAIEVTEQNNNMKEIYLKILEVNIETLREKYPEESSSYEAMMNAIKELRKITP